jgi:hypothetical protein
VVASGVAKVGQGVLYARLENKDGFGQAPAIHLEISCSLKLLQSFTPLEVFPKFLDRSREFLLEAL